MMPTPEQVAPHMARFLDMLDAAFRRYGVPDGLPERFRHAVAATPRHLFVHQFRLRGGPLENRTGEGSLWDSDADPVGELADIYSDAVMTHVNAAGERLPSTNSQPSYVLWLLHLLDLRPGQRVLEIGSGSGWLAAVMARLIGENGRVTGIEIIPDLASQCRADLAQLGIGNVSVLANDGAQGDATGAPFDRVMITAASWDLPAVLFDQVTEGGRVLVPVELRGGGCQVTVLRREGDEFVAERAVPGWVCAIARPGAAAAPAALRAAGVPVLGGDRRRCPATRTVASRDGPASTADSAVAAFRAFLGRTASNFVVFGSGEPPEQLPGLPAAPFGVVDEAECSVALWSGGELLGYGGAAAMRSLARAYASWASCGLPGLARLGLRVVRAGTAPAGDGPAWVEKRGGTALVWRPLPDAEDWKELVGSGP